MIVRAPTIPQRFVLAGGSVVFLGWGCLALRDAGVSEGVSTALLYLGLSCFVTAIILWLIAYTVHVNPEP